MALLACLPVGLAIGAEAVELEREPNDTPSGYLAISPPARLAGALPAGDQDGFLWSVSDNDARLRWNIALEGVPGALTVVEVVRLTAGDEPGAITKTDVVYRLASRDGSARVQGADLLLEPGDYVLGVAGAGQGGGFRPAANLHLGLDAATAKPATSELTDGGYRILVSAGAELRFLGKPLASPTAAEATALRLGDELAAYAQDEVAWFGFRVDGSRRGERLRLAAQLPLGRAGRLVLVDPQGRELQRAEADRSGRLRLDDLGLAAGEYKARLELPGGQSVLAVALSASGATVGDAEAEPNDSWSQANRVAFAEPVSGRAGRGGDNDYFQFSQGPDDAGPLQTLSLDTDADAAFELCLLDGEGRRLQCRDGKGAQQLPDLALEPGHYGVLVARGAQGKGYRIRRERGAEPAPGIEAEPNDSLETASAFPVKQRVKGRFHGRDTDFHRLVLTGAPQLWRFQVNGKGASGLRVMDGAGVISSSVRVGAGARGARLDNLYLLPGTHYVAVEGVDGEYTLLARSLGEPDPSAELEPNDDPTRAQALPLGQSRKGILAEASDLDRYRFSLANYDRVRLRVEVLPDTAIAADLRWGGEHLGRWARPGKGVPIGIDGVFPPGDYELTLQATEPGESPYAVTLERLPRFACPVDCEPNDRQAFGTELPFDVDVEGEAGQWRDDDLYRLPAVQTPTTARLETAKALPLKLLGAASGPSAPVFDRSAGHYEIRLQPGAQALLQVGAGAGAYRMRLSAERSDQPGMPASVTLPIRLQATTERIAAQVPEAQQVEAEAVIENPTAEPVSVALELAISDARWRAAASGQPIAIAAGVAARVPVRIVAPPDVRADVPVRVSARVVANGRTLGHAGLDVHAAADAPRVGALPHSPLPDALLGGLNVAAARHGARRLPAAGEVNGDDLAGVYRGADELFDGLAVQGSGLVLDGRRPGPVEITVALAGDVPVPVAGFVLAPLALGERARQLREFEVLLSEDGGEFIPVLSAVLDPLRTEQAFVLPGDHSARFARLRLLSGWGPDDRSLVGLGEWKVVARPGFTPRGLDAPNLADPTHGGHVVWAAPPISRDWDAGILTTAADVAGVRIAAGVEPAFVIGFHHNRAARIRRLQWRHAAEAPEAQRAQRASVWVSVASPVGPWQKLADWPLDRAEGVLEVAQPVWARFVRVVVEQGRAGSFWPPESLRVIEAPASDDYLSILGEWGEAATAAGLERSRREPVVAALPARSNSSRESAANLSAGEAVTGEVQLEQHTHWYRVDVPADRNLLTFTLTGEPTVRTDLRLTDGAGNPLPLLVLERGPAQHRLEAMVEPGSAVFIEVAEQPRNLAFLWDTSGSVAPYIAQIYAALARYAEGLSPGRDSANFFPFGSRALMSDWHAEPYLLQTVLNEHPRTESSSEAEAAIERATRALAPRPGSKAIVVITDAATGRYAPVWSALDAVKPTIFGLGLHSQGAFGRNPAREQDLLQDWTAVAGGDYRLLLDHDEMETALERLLARLRQPAPYALRWAATFEESTEPARLSVVRAVPPAKGRQAKAEAGAVALILDASGSMLKRFDGRRRIDIAREVLADVVQRRLPAGTPTLLRVFGHKEANSCRQDLEVPLGPLKPKEMATRLAKVEPKNLAKTPLAGSLDAVRNDLARVPGPKTVVLLTDGEETCGGKPADAIAALQRAAGVDVRVNIVGLAIGDEALEKQLTDWAEATGGRYLKADDRAGLLAGLENAVAIRFRVVDVNDVERGTGLVDGAPIELPPGDYRVLIEHAAWEVPDQVVLRRGGDVRVSVVAR